MEIITAKDLCKCLGAKQVIDNVSIHVKQGEIYGFLGPNGAGKTTLMRMLLNLVKADSGSIWLFGEEITQMQPSLLRRIGNMIEYPIFYNHLTVKENLELQCSYMGIEAEEGGHSRRLQSSDTQRIPLTRYLLQI